MENKVVGVVRKVDNVGRLVIPPDLYKQFNIFKGGEVEITATEEGILVRKHEKADIKADIHSIIQKYESDGINFDMVKSLKKMIEA